MAIDYETALLDLATKHGRYRPNAYRFTLDAVSHTVTRHERTPSRQWQGSALGIRELALSRYGPMAKYGLRASGAFARPRTSARSSSTVDEGLLGKTESDRKSDFASGYDFEETFVRGSDWLDRIAPKRRWVIE
jgi:uncharacterized repeat protein (TIGR04138 family)